MKQYLPDNIMQQNMGYEDDQQSLQDLFDRSDDFEERHLIISQTPKPPQKRMTRRRTLIQCNPDDEEPGVLEDSDQDMVAKYFKTNSGERDLCKYGTDKAVKKAKTMAAIMH